DPDGERSNAAPRWRRMVLAITALIGITVLSGGFVAGLRAGTIYNTFPLMGGQVVPPGYGALTPWWRNAFENPAAAQFHHRVLALLTATLTLILAVRSGSAATAGLLDERARQMMQWLGGVVVLQVLLGITTLLLVVPVALGALHQFT